MELSEGIKTRRSIRKYKETEVNKELIEEIISTARSAPSWKNTQTAQYVVVLNQDIRNQIAQEGLMGFEWNKNIIKNLPALIIETTVNGMSGYDKDGSYSTAKGSHWQSFDAGIAAQTVCLSAHAKGLGTIIMGIFDEAKIAQIIKLPPTHSISALIGIGYPDESPQMPPRKEVKEVVTFL